MPVAKLRANSTPDAMKSLEGNDSIDTFIRQAIGKEPFLSYPRTVDPQVQWVQLLQALEQPGSSKFSSGTKIISQYKGGSIL